MAQYSLSGTGTQGLTAGTTSLYVVVTTPSVRSYNGQAYPANLINTGLLRPGVSNFFLPVIPVDAVQQLVNLPAGITEIGYALLGGAVISVSEGTPPTSTATLYTDIVGTSVAAGTAVKVSWAGVGTAATARDWITFMPSGSSSPDLDGIFGPSQWCYTNSCTTTPGTTVVPDGSCTQTLTFHGTSGAGNYEVVYFTNDTDTALMSASTSYNVT